MRSFVMALAYVAAVADLCAAGTFVGKAYMEFSAASGTIPRFPVDVVMTTDYSTLNWTISWDVPETTVIGGPNQTFQTSFGTRGSMTLRDSIKLGLPNASGTVSSSVLTYPTAPDTVEFFGTSRVVTRNETWYTTGTSFSSYFTTHALNVAAYPESLKLTAIGAVAVEMTTKTTDNNTVSLVGRLYRFATGTSQGIESLFYEPLPGDFTSDGLVDAADYTVARDTAYPMTALLTDLDTWRRFYGSGLGTVGTAASSVPEPTTIAITASLVGLTSSISWRHSRRQRITPFR